MLRLLVMILLDRNRLRAKNRQELIGSSSKNDIAQKGFTLMEVMVAVSILAISLTAVFSLLAQSVRVANETKFSTMAAMLAQSKMAEIQTMGLDELQSNSGEFEDTQAGFFWAVEVEDVVLGETGNMGEYLKKIVLTVSWGEVNPLTYKLTTYLYLPA